ncbi:hypothetical protein AOXY_G20280 [Acipenser oxyrinchus oxyrinchus]|uniref:Uncharacterized protein n=1 Tax=Acipenser oxyrinchus oxyrinchus TaxID=40147 RepID=A0AAD8D189_ACIOX|nr:hypothetical protein AOXY_G20280 [Acipenser oxyrinchus oxyrinchus]
MLNSKVNSPIRLPTVSQCWLSRQYRSTCMRAVSQCSPGSTDPHACVLCLRALQAVQIHMHACCVSVLSRQYRSTCMCAVSQCWLSRQYRSTCMRAVSQCWLSRQYRSTCMRAVSQCWFYAAQYFIRCLFTQSPDCEYVLCV